MGTYAETLQWLRDQLDELDRWRSDMLSEATDEGSSSLERIDAHRRWLEAELSKLSAPQLERSFS
ncbi:MAG: hypothetical protein AAGJ32_01645 [Pseudomonadota bacterium]